MFHAVNWVPYGKGSFKTVYVSNRPCAETELQHTVYGYWIRKYAHSSPLPIDRALANTDRLVKLWNKVNLAHKAIKLHDGSWAAPYISGRLPTDLEVARKIVEIYRDHQLVILDACSTKNFIKEHNGRITCIDFDLALHKEEQVSQVYYGRYVLKHGYFTEIYQQFFANHAAKFRQLTVMTIKCLVRYDRSVSVDRPALEALTLTKLLSFCGILFEEREDKQEEHIPLIDIEEQKPVHLAQSSKEIFLHLHRREMMGVASCIHECCTRVDHDNEQSLLELVTHAQKDTRWFGRDVRSATIMKRLGWLDKNKRVIPGSGLAQSLGEVSNRFVEPNPVGSELSAY